MSDDKHDSRQGRPGGRRGERSHRGASGPAAPATPNTHDPAGETPDAEAGAEQTASGWSGPAAANAELEALRAEVTELKDKLLRAMAEMENLRRRTERDKADTAKYAISAFARDILTVGDNLARAIAAVPRDQAETDAALKALLEGVEVTERELLNILERHGVKKLEPAGERFDPNHHQAMLEMDNPEVPAGTVLQVLQAGYMIDDRVLRPALVAVSRGGEKLSRSTPEGEPGGDAAPDGPSSADPATNDGTGSETRRADPPGSRLDRSA